MNSSSSKIIFRYLNEVVVLNKYNMLFLFALFCLLTIHTQSASAEKPSPPIQISITPTQPGITPADIHPGDTIAFKIAVKSSINAQKMRIGIELTGGAELVSGDSSWSGPVTEGEEISISLIVRAPMKGRGKISARVSIPGNHRQLFSAETQYQLGNEGIKKAEPKPPVKKDGRGRNIIEYR